MADNKIIKASIKEALFVEAIMYDIPVIITDSFGKVLLKNKAAAEKVKKIGYLSDISKYLADGWENTLSSLSPDSSAVIPTSGLGRMKFAMVLGKVYSGTSLFVFLLLDANERESAILAECDLVPEDMLTPKLYMLGLEIKNIRRELYGFLGGRFENCLFSELFDELEKCTGNLQFFDSSIDLIYENNSFARVSQKTVPSVLFSALGILLGVCDSISASKKITILADSFDDTLLLSVKTEVESGEGMFFRSIDIFESGLVGEEMRSPLELCATLFGADDRKISVSLDGVSGKSFVIFEYRIKDYEKRPAGIKTDPEFKE